jgi:hypothetical protein
MGSVLKQSEGTHKSISKEKAEICTAFQRNPSKSIHQASRKLYVPYMIMHRVFNKQLHMFAYKVQITKELKQDKPK